jgi:ribosomal protein L32
MVKSRWEQYKEKNGVTPLDLLNPQTKRASDELAESRIAVCKTCPEFFSPTSQCKKCGCIMPVKVKFEAAKCPLDKWSTE